MAIKAIFSATSKHVTVNGLTQWDYGRVLEIESSELGSEIVEVHFACSSMGEAVVRSCAFVNGIGEVTIPDQCLEQSSPVTAWVYRIVGTQGYTFGTITMPITARARPSVAREIPQEISDKYTELITEVNEAVNALESGDVVVKQATHAAQATNATTAGNAATANYATSAGSATKASHNSAGRSLSEILTCTDAGYSVRNINSFAFSGGIVAFRIRNTATKDEVHLITEIGGHDSTVVSHSSIFYDEYYEVTYPMRLCFTSLASVGSYKVSIERYDASTQAWTDISSYPNRTVYFQYLSDTYNVG